MKKKSQERQTRRVLYRVLQALYSYPLSREKVEPLLDLTFESEPVEMAFASLRNVLAKVTDWEDFVDRLNVEYTRLNTRACSRGRASFPLRLMPPIL